MRVARSCAASNPTPPVPENRDSVAGRRIKDPSATHLMKQEPGDFAWEFDFTHFDHGAKETDQVLTVYVRLPGELRWSPLHVTRGGVPTTHRVWGWDGNLDKPTFEPSIHHPGVWHGYMRAGRLESC